MNQLMHLQQRHQIIVEQVDSTNTDAKLLPCLIVEKLETDKNVTFKLVCQYGKLENTYSIEHLVDLKLACPDELKQIVINNLKGITFIEACKLYFFVCCGLIGDECDDDESTNALAAASSDNC
ncbi:unnamed protein product [Rotaria sp. Silwood2]|nr:unnamed protein product [Rotaria sp. Silwood2]